MDRFSREAASPWRGSLVGVALVVAMTAALLAFAVLVVAVVGWVVR